MRLIDADATKARSNSLSCQSRIAGMALAKMNQLIDSMPTVDAAEVVRCKDCKWFADNNNGEWYGCWLYNTILSNERDKPGRDDFCSCGERRTDG